MKLENMDTLWGIPIIKLKEYSKKYRLYFTLLVLADIAVFSGLAYAMYIQEVSFTRYFTVAILFSIVVNLILNNCLNPARWRAFKFYKNNKFNKVKVVSYDINEKNFYSILYCVGYKRLRQNKSLDEYKELLLSACCEDIYYAKKVMKLFKKYENESGCLTAYILVKGNREYFLDYKLDDKVVEEEVIKEDNEECQ